jgi:hypothetical protein
MEIPKGVRFMQTSRVVLTFLLGCGLILATEGCGNRNGAVPESVTVELPDGTTTTVTLGAGVPSLADSTWDFYITGQLESSAAQGLPFLVITFGPQGELTRFDGNTLSPEIFGDTIYFDGGNHSTNQQGLSYTAGTYGAETSDASGFSFVGKLTAFAVGLTVANATVTATGTFDADDPDTMTGEFTFSVQATVDFIPNANVDQGFTFIAHRVGV